MKAIIEPNQAGIKPKPTGIEPDRIEIKPNPNQIQIQNQAKIKILEDNGKHPEDRKESPRKS